MVMRKQKILDTLQSNPSPGKISAIDGVIVLVACIDLEISITGIR
jgi:hypothetical protein